MNKLSGLVLLFIGLWGVAPLGWAQGTTLPPDSIVVNGGFANLGAGWGWTYNLGIMTGSPLNFAYVYGTLYQDLNTVPGQAYQITFAMSGNLNLPQTAVLQVLWGSQTVGSPTWNPAGNSIYNRGWETETFEATATSASTLLTFSNPNVGTQDLPAVYAVSVIPVPEPSAMALLAVGVCSCALMQRRSRPRL